MAIKEFLENQGYRNIQKRTKIALTILILSVIIFTLYLLLFYTKPCLDSECFVNAMENCGKVTWIKEDSKASWVYTIIDKADDQTCDVEVTLFKVKQGPAENEKLVGKSMICNLRKGETKFPEEDILRCSGVLKEEIQEIIIQQMYNYLIENIGEIREEFKGI